MCDIFILYPHINYTHFSTIHYCWRKSKNNKVHVSSICYFSMMAHIAIAIAIAIVSFSWTNLSKGERYNEVNPM